QEIGQTAYFRGRKLRGRRVELPEGYEGVVAVPTDRILPASNPGVKTDYSQNEQDGAIDGDSEEPVKVLEKQATFNEFVVWGHEVLPAADDPFVKGVEEWLKFAEAMHSSAPPSTENGKPGSSTEQTST
ncbi:Ribonuclease H2 subunit C, partial [Rasamsonia emersonii CBS 393.64]